ncbi:unnamed protein product [Arctogadus glacialis]
MILHELLSAGAPSNGDRKEAFKETLWRATDPATAQRADQDQAGSPTSEALVGWVAESWWLQARLEPLMQRFHCRKRLQWKGLLWKLFMYGLETGCYENRTYCVMFLWKVNGPVDH